MSRTRQGSGVARIVAALVLGVLAAVPITLVAALLAPSPAEATTYRYWTYWWGRPAKSGWQFAQLGPASDVPGDGWVLGWRFGVTSTNGSGGKAPRVSHIYADLCGNPVAAPGQRRVAVVVDYGSEADAPPGETPPRDGSVRVECVSVADLAHGFEAMRTAGLTVRQGGDGFVCGLDGYPRTECSAAVVASTAPTPAPSITPSTKPSTAAPPKPGTTPSSRAVTTPPVSSARTSGAATSAAPASSGVATSTGPSLSPSTSASPTDTPAAVVGAESTLPASSGAPVAAGPDAPSSGSALGFLGGAVVVGAIGTAAWWNARRRTDTP